MLHLIKQKSQKPVYLLFLSLSLTFLSACSPHPAVGTWAASADNQTKYAKILIHFDPKLEIYTQSSDKPVQHCGWSAVGKQKIEMECMSSGDQKEMDKYQLNMINKDTAELIHEGKVVASFTLVDEK